MVFAKRVQPSSAVTRLAILLVAMSVRAGAETRLALEIQPWADSLRTPVYAAADSKSVQPMALGILAPGRPVVSAQARRQALRVDGDLSDWRFVRWMEVNGAPASQGGLWNGPGDVHLRWSLTWTADGLYCGARILDDDVALGIRPIQEQESFVLALGSDSPFVQNYWIGPSRRFRIRRGGRVEAWTDLRGRRSETFDAAALGVEAAVRSSPTASGGTTEFEVFVPWDAVFPYLPGSGSLGCNAFVEDFDSGTTKQLVAVRDSRNAATWARIDFSGDLPPGTWIVAQGARVPEDTCEWVVTQWRGDGPVSIELRLAQEQEAQILTGILPARPARIRVSHWPASDTWQPSARSVDVDWRLQRGASFHRSRVTLRPDRAALQSELRAPVDGAEEVPFPSPVDVHVRWSKALEEMDAAGTWAERRHHATGIQAWRRAAWTRIETQLAEAEILSDVVLQPNESAARGRLAARWPARSRLGLPLGEVILRGYRSELDGSVQPYAVFAPAALADGMPRPLVTALHGFGEDAFTWFETTTLRERCEARGWIAVCPLGRGNTGYERAGERDVLDVLERTRRSLPVDARRLHLLGAGMGGTGTWLLSLRHPRLFATATVISGYGDLNQIDLFTLLGYDPEERADFESRNPVKLLRPDLDTAYRVAHGERDNVVSVVNARVMHDALQTLGVSHEFHIDPLGDAGTRFWDSELAPGFEHMARHAREKDGVVEASLFETAGGPVAACFERGPWAIVYGTQGEGSDADRRSAEQLALEWQARFLGIPRLVADASVSAAMQAEFDFLLVGTPRTNLLLARWETGLPVRHEEEGFTVNGRFYPGHKFGVLYAARNPEFEGRSMVVASGMLDRIQSGKTLYRLGADFIVVGPEGTAPVVGHFASGSWR